MFWKAQIFAIKKNYKLVIGIRKINL